MQKCIFCEDLKDKLKRAKEINDSDLARIAYEQMREHKSHVKYPAKHGFK